MKYISLIRMLHAFYSLVNYNCGFPHKCLLPKMCQALHTIKFDGRGCSLMYTYSIIKTTLLCSTWGHFGIIHEIALASTKQFCDVKYKCVIYRSRFCSRNFRICICNFRLIRALARTLFYLLYSNCI